MSNRIYIFAIRVCITEKHCESQYYGIPVCEQEKEHQKKHLVGNHMYELISTHKADICEHGVRRHGC